MRILWFPLFIVEHLIKTNNMKESKTIEAIVVCGGRLQLWKDYRNATKFYLEGAMSCDGSEKERYNSIFSMLYKQSMKFGGGVLYASDVFDLWADKSLPEFMVAMSRRTFFVYEQNGKYSFYADGFEGKTQIVKDVPCGCEESLIEYPSDNLLNAMGSMMQGYIGTEIIDKEIERTEDENNISKLNLNAEPEILGVFKLDRDKYPFAWNNKVAELMEQGMSREDAEDAASKMDFQLEIYYEKDYGMFAVESDAVECNANIYSPYSGKILRGSMECDDIPTYEGAFIHRGYYNVVADLEELSGKSADYIVNYMKEGMGVFNTVSNSDAFAHIEEEVLGIFKNTTRLSSDFRFLVTDNLGGRDYVRKSSDADNTASDCYIDVWELC